MKARYMTPRPSPFKVFKETSLTIPGLAVTPDMVIKACRNGEPVRTHSSGSYEPDASLDHISPFQRGFELTDMASSPSEMKEYLSSLERDIRKVNVDSRIPARSAEGTRGEAVRDPEQAKGEA